MQKHELFTHDIFYFTAVNNDTSGCGLLVLKGAKMAWKQRQKDTFPLNYIQTDTDKEGSGLYSDVSLTQHVISQAALPLLLKAVESIPVKSGSVFTIVDYGTADGGTSMVLIYACVKALREKYGEELSINVIYEDQPVNDFKSLFMRVHGLIPGPPSFLQDFPNVFVMACGTSFYHQCLPIDSVTLGLSTTAMHWLRDIPCDMTGALLPAWITVPEEKEKFRDQAERDWELILLNRAAELKTGGRMVLILPCSEGDDRKYHKSHSEWIFPAFLNILDELADEEIVTKEEVNGTNFMMKRRTVEELKKPFQSENSPVRQAGLKLISIETHVAPCQHNLKWMKEKGDARQHAKEFVASIRTWGTSTFMAGLSDSRSPEEKAKIVDEFFQRYEDEVAKHPEDHGMHSAHAYLEIEKRL